MSAIDTITIQDFKDLFYRDFPYLSNITWVAGTYNTGDEVYYTVTSLFYKALLDGVTSTPDTPVDWALFTDDVLNYIIDQDIQKAFDEAAFNFNTALFSSDEECKLAYLYLAAHFLVLDIRRGAQGVNSKGDYVAQSQSVGNVSESLHIPDAILNNPILQQFGTTSYGSKYLNLVMPRLVGGVRVVKGQTNP